MDRQPAPPATVVDRSVGVVIRFAGDLARAVDVLVAEFGADATLQALARLPDPERAGRAMWLVVERGVGALRPAASGRDGS